MAKLIDILDDYFKGVKFDKKLMKKIHRWGVDWRNKNEDHRSFFGGNLIGVHTIRFTLSDITSYTRDIYGIDIDKLQDDVFNDHNLRRDWKVSKDAFNIVSAYVIYKFITVGKLEKGAVEAAKIFNYRAISILHSDYFKYPISEQEAVTVYAQLSGRYLLKKYGNWQRVVEVRSRDMVAKGSLVDKDLIKNKFDTMAYIRTVNDAQGRIRDMMKNIYRVMLDVKTKGDIIGSASPFITDAEGEEVLMDVTTAVSQMTRYLLDILPDKSNFIREEHITIVRSLLPTLKVKFLEISLEALSNRSIEPEIQDFMELYMSYTANYLEDKGYNLSDSKYIDKMLLTIRGLWLSSRSADEDLIKLRTIGDNIVSEAIHKKTKSVVVSTRIGVFIYLFLRAVTYKHYLAK